MEERNCFLLEPIPPHEVSPEPPITREAPFSFSDLIGPGEIGDRAIRMILRLDGWSVDGDDDGDEPIGNRITPACIMAHYMAFDYGEGQDGITYVEISSHMTDVLQLKGEPIDWLDIGDIGESYFMMPVPFEDPMKVFVRSERMDFNSKKKRHVIYAPGLAGAREKFRSTLALFT